MKRTVFLILFLISTLAVFSNDRFRFYFLLDLPLEERPTYEGVNQQLAKEENLYGLGMEYIFDNIGFGFDGTVNFTYFEDDTLPDGKDWWMDWNGSLFLNYHLFEQDFLFDPFVGIGIGQAGRVDITDEENYTAEDEDEVTNLSAYPFFTAGVNIDLGSVFIGGKARFHNRNYIVPATQYNEYPLSNFSFALNAGFSF